MKNSMKFLLVWSIFIGVVLSKTGFVYLSDIRWWLIMVILNVIGILIYYRATGKLFD